MFCEILFKLHCDNFLRILNIIEKILLVITVIALISLITFFCIGDFSKVNSDSGKLSFIMKSVAW